MKQRQQKQEIGPRELGNGLILLANILSVILRTLLAAPGTIGSRELGSISRAWAMLVTPVVIVLFGGSGEAVVGVLGLYVLSHAVHSAHARKNRLHEVHSFAMGTPELCRFVPNITSARYLEALLLMAGGAVLLGVEPGIGAWMGIGGASHLIVVAWVNAKQHATDLDLQDSHVEARARAARMGSETSQPRWR